MAGGAWSGGAGSSKVAQVRCDLVRQAWFVSARCGSAKYGRLGEARSGWARLD
jgi:hypothetical protein